MIVTLEKWEYEWASHVGIRRMTARTGSKNAKHYSDESRQQIELLATIASACCELAVAKAYNVYWPGHYWESRDHGAYKHLADVGQTIEVRRVRKENGPFAVRPAEVRAGKTMVAAYAHEPDFRKVTVYGHIKAADAWSLGEPSDFDPDGTRYCPINYLKSKPKE